MHVKFSIILIAVLVYMSKLRSDYERGHLKTDHYFFSSPKIKERHKLLFLSDLHEKEFGKDNVLLLDRIRSEKPDCILIGGDMIVCHKPHFRKRKRNGDAIENSVKFLNVLKQEFPVYFAYGNHELRLFEKAGLRPDRSGTVYSAEERCTALQQSSQLLESLKGITVLDDSAARAGELSIRGISLTLDYYQRLFLRKKKAFAADFLQKSPAEEDPERYHIWLLHSPLYFHEAADAGADLVLCGHFHGGTIRLPHFGGLMTPQYQFLVRECSGVFHYGQSAMLVNRGLGTHSVNIRINDLPELSVIELAPPAVQHAE